MEIFVAVVGAEAVTLTKVEQLLETTVMEVLLVAVVDANEFDEARAFLILNITLKARNVRKQFG